MRILSILEKVITGKKVKFIETIISSGSRTGNKVVAIVDLETTDKLKFVIAASINNFLRFKKWIGKEAYADYDINKHTFCNTELGKLATVQIRTDVEVEKENYKEKHRDDEGDEYYGI
jgi:hypothetical protein